MASFTFRGLMAPVFTAFNKDLTVDTSVVPNYAQFLKNSEIQGILVHGTTGEGMSMTVEERKKSAEAWVAAGKTTKQHIMIQVGGCPLPDAQELARHAEKIGADSILCLPELYFKPSNPSELILYLKDIAVSAPNTPLLYYHIPAWSGVNINMKDFLNEMVGKVPTFHGIKYTSNDLASGYDALKAADGRYAVFLGADTLMASAFTLGFDSSIATSLNICPQLAVKILKAIKASKVDEARETQQKLIKICEIITKDGAWVPTMKHAMNALTPLRVGPSRPPLKNLSAGSIKEIEEGCKKLLSSS